MTVQMTVDLERKRPFTLPTLLIFLFLGSTALLISGAALFVTHMGDQDKVGANLFSM